MDGLPASIAPALAGIADVCIRHHVRSLDLFGSATGDRYDPASSDLDFLVDFDEVGHGEGANAFFALRRDLEDLFDRPVDLLTPAALDNPFLRRSVVATRRRVYPVGMIAQEAAKHVWDARSMVRRLIDMTAGRSREDYRADGVLQLAVERALGIIGEAFVRLRRDWPDVAAQVPDLPQAVAFRNILVHEYDTLNQDIVWDVVQTKLPDLLGRLDDLLARAPGDE